MKKNLFYWCFITFLVGCTNQDNPSNSTVPAAPTNLVATLITNTSVNLHWSDISTNESGYKIQRKLSNGIFVDVGSTGADVEDFSDVGLTSNTTYIYRVYAFNAAGNSAIYSNELTVTTSGTDSIPSIVIGNQTWSIKNLNQPRYRNGDLIPQVTDPTQWSNLTTGAWCWYDNDSATYALKYGRLYNWYAVNDPRKLAPQGWRIPTESDWNKLVKYLDLNADTICQGCSQSATAGGEMKSTNGWNVPNIGATNLSGFTALPGGYRTELGVFAFVGFKGGWWSSPEYGNRYAWYRILQYDQPSVSRFDYFKSYGYSVRLIRE